MTPLRQRMMQDLQLRGYSDRTVEAYVHAVAQLTKFYHASPDQLTEEQVRHQELVYAMLLREAAATVQTLAEDRTWVGGTPGVLAVLHTWTRTMEYHPHAHLLVTAGGLARDGSAWVKPTHPRFLMPGYALAPIFRAKMRTALSRAGLAQDVDPIVWANAWVVHVQQIGRGAQAIRYLSRYVYHVALTNHRLETFDHGRVTFRYTHARTHETRRLTLPVDTFIARFLQHVLPRGFTKIRYYGLLSPTRRTDLERARHFSSSTRWRHPLRPVTPQRSPRVSPGRSLSWSRWHFPLRDAVPCAGVERSALWRAFGDAGHRRHEPTPSSCSRSHSSRRRRPRRHRPAGLHPPSTEAQFQRASRRVPPARRAPESPSQAVVAPPSTALFLAGRHR